jgi:tRNA (adenine57-N1/adenine58-N1)-methyltransferase catalytic subunit
MKISEGAYVLFFHQASKNWLTKVEKNKKLHTHIGIIDFDQVIGLEYGSSIMTPKQKKVYLMEPSVYDFVMKSDRKTQIVYPKDLGYIAIRTGLKSGSNVLEIGTGSASLTTFFASLVEPGGHVFTYDVNEEFMEIASRNLKKSGMEKNVTMFKHDIMKEGLEEQSNIDVAIIDLGDPWNILQIVHKCLKNSGSVAIICPTMNQLEKTAKRLHEVGFTDIESSEIMIRNIEAREGKTRPSTRMIGHTTYLIFARKIIQDTIPS